MSALFEDNYELYGGDAQKMLDGVWASLGASFVGSATLTIPAWEEQDRYWLAINGRGDGARAVFPAGGQTGVGVWAEMYLPELPTTAGRGFPIQLRNASDDVLVGLVINTDGTISAYGNPSGFAFDGLTGATLIATTTVPVLQAATTHYLQMEVDFSAGDLELRVDGVAVISVSSNASVGGTCVGIAHQQNDDSGGTYAQMYFKGVAAYSLSGTYNSSWPAISGIKTVLINADTATDNLTPRPRNHFDTAVLFNDRIAGDAGIRIDENSNAFDYGTGDYTLEGYFRFIRSPESGETFNLLGVWNESNDERCYRLALKASDVDGGGLQFQYSTDGTDGTVVTVHDVNWEPQIGVWYHIAVARDSSTNDNRLFIDGVQQGTDQTDSATYNAGNSDHFCIGNITSSSSGQALGSDAFYGHLQDIRVTKGIVRYTANFTIPTTFFPTASPADPNFSSVSLLVPFSDPNQDPVLDVSSNNFTLDLGGGCSIVDYEDEGPSYLAAGTTNPLDDRYLESAFPKASGILTLTDQPGDTETVVIGSRTYTFNTTLGAANSILIGASVNDSLQNLTDAINGGDGSGTRYGTGTATNTDVTAENNTPSASQMTVTAILGGTGDNSLATTETLTDGSWGGSTLSGGANLPGASEFEIQSLPPDATGVRWLSIRHRSYLDDGSATIRTNLDVNGSESSNDDNGLTTDPQYYVSRIEEDPDTSAALTVSSIENAKLKIERTA